MHFDYFAQYAQELIKRLNYSNQCVFMDELLTAALGHKPECSSSSLKNYFAGKTVGKGNEKQIVGDKIGHFAVEYFGKIDSEGLKQKLAEMINEAGAASEICSAFIKECPGITPDNVEGIAESLTASFTRLIDKARNEYSSNNQSKPTGSANNTMTAIINNTPVSSANTATGSITISKRDADKMQKLIEQIVGSMYRLKELGSRIFVSSRNDPTLPQLRSDYDTEYGKYLELMDELRFWCKKYHTQACDDIINGEDLDFDTCMIKCREEEDGKRSIRVDGYKIDSCTETLLNLSRMVDQLTE